MDIVSSFSVFNLPKTVLWRFTSCSCRRVRCVPFVLLWSFGRIIASFPPLLLKIRRARNRTRATKKTSCKTKSSKSWSCRRREMDQNAGVAGPSGVQSPGTPPADPNRFFFCGGCRAVGRSKSWDTACWSKSFEDDRHVCWPVPRESCGDRVDGTLVRRACRWLWVELAVRLFLLLFFSTSSNFFELEKRFYIAQQASRN